MSRVDGNTELNSIGLSHEERTGQLPPFIGDLIRRLRLDRVAEIPISVPARERGSLRRKLGYSAAMLVEESRILQVSIFNALQNNLGTVDFSTVLLDVMTIADEVDSQLKQTMLGFLDPRAEHVSTGTPPDSYPFRVQIV